MNSPIFIVGCDRSGTTLLRLLLNQSTEVHIPMESGFLSSLRDNIVEYGDFTDPRSRWFFIRDLQHTRATSKTRAFDIFGLTEEEAEAVLAAASPTDFAGAASSLFQATAERNGKTVWGDKTPRHVLCMDWLAQAFDDSRFIHIVRDPRDVAMSMRRAGWGKNYRDVAEFWRSRVSAGLAAGGRLPNSRYYEVRYEQLVRQPELELERLCQWLGIEYCDRMLEFYKTGDQQVPKEHKELFPLLQHPIDGSRAFAWRRTMGRRAIADVESVTRELLTDLGYELSGTRQHIWVRTLRWFYHRLRPVVERATAAELIGVTPREGEGASE